MNRRDTIIIAVLLNATLLAVLFVMAVNTGESSLSQENNATAIVSAKEESKNLEQEVHLTSLDTKALQEPADEIDNALKLYANNPQMILVDDEFSDHIDKEPITPAPPVSTTPPQNPEPPKEGTPSSLVEVTVKRGDALEKIARANGTTVEAIKRANDLKTSKLNIGQILKVPVGTKKVAAATTTKPQESNKTIASSQIEYYTIKSGDNPWKIAKQYNVRFDDLLKLNGLDEDKARNLKVGDQIRVR